MGWNPNLNEMQRAWAQALVLNKFNYVKAAEVAGYKKSNLYDQANKNKQNPYLMAYVEELRKEIAEKVKVDATDVVNGIADIASAQKEKDPAVALKALELLGRYLGMFGLNGKVAITSTTNNNQTTIEVYIPDNKRDQRVIDVAPQNAALQLETDKKDVEEN